MFYDNFWIVFNHKFWWGLSPGSGLEFLTSQCSSEIWRHPWVLQYWRLLDFIHGTSSTNVEILPDCNTVYTSGDTRIFSQPHPLPVITEHKHPYGLKNPKFQCFFYSVLQLIFSIFRNNSYTSPFNSSTEGIILKCMLQTAHNACNSKDVDALKSQLVRHDIFDNGQNQEDSTECLLMLMNIIHKGSMPVQVWQLLLRGLLYLTSCFHLFWKNILSAMYVDWVCESSMWI